ncbi:MAG TPA: xanthine dehydrogenase family protein molybdopterin-binding subunit, partial [Nakamurella multipartita]|nr:xanthine dehydrogenase family protein molybdopterin-binding subunit [Nakamurella multipartita]
MTELADRPVASTPAVGQSVRRKEDARLLTGNTNWTDNIQLPGALHMVFVRSPYAHARITRVDLTAARAMPGVVAAYAAADLGEANPKIICVWPVTDD